MIMWDISTCNLLLREKKMGDVEDFGESRTNSPNLMGTIITKLENFERKGLNNCSIKKGEMTISGK